MAEAATELYRIMLCFKDMQKGMDNRHKGQNDTLRYFVQGVGDFSLDGKDSCLYLGRALLFFISIGTIHKQLGSFYP